MTPSLPAGWPPLPAALASQAVTASQTEYQWVRSTYMRRGTPAVVLRPTSEEHVAEAVGYAAAVRHATGVRVPFSVRSGGHGISGAATNDGGIVVNLSGLNRLDVVDPDAGILHAQAGATWGAVAATLMPHDRALTSGNVGSTGVGGLATAGGIGYLARSQGLTLDHIRRALLVTADGAIRWVDSDNHPDLFWAVRGGATTAGIVVDLVLDAPHIGSEAGGAAIISQEVQYLVEDLPSFTKDWGQWITSSPRQTESFLMLQDAGGGRAVVQARNVWAGDDVTAALPTLQSALELTARVMQQSASVMPYPQLVPTFAGPHTGAQTIQMRDVLVDRADEELGAAMAESLGHDATALVEVRALGGAVSDAPTAATAWAGRHQEALVATWAHPLGEQTVDASFDALLRLGTGAYGAYSSDTRPAAADRAWPGATGERLRAVADAVDPDRLFDSGLVLPRPGAQH